MTHTPEPWAVQPIVEDGAQFIIGCNLGGLVGAALSWPTEIDSGDFSRVEANARRIVAAINATAGISTEDLEAGVVRELREENARMRQEIADLHNSINIVGSAYDKAVKALDEMVADVRRRTHAALTKVGAQ